MKALALFFALSVSAMAFGQNTQYTFTSPKLKLNKQGESQEMTTAEPTIIKVNLEAQTLTIESNDPAIRALMDEKMTRPIIKQMGDIGPQYSLSIDGNVFAHFYLDGRQMIMFTRSDIHPLEWGMMFLEVKQAE